MSLKEEIIEVLKEEISPMIQMDGGDVEFVELSDDNLLTVRLTGACVGCAAAGITLRIGIERHLKLKFPELQGVLQA